MTHPFLWGVIVGVVGTFVASAVGGFVILALAYRREARLDVTTKERREMMLREGRL